MFLLSNPNIKLSAEGEYVRETIVDGESEKIFEFYDFQELTSTNGSKKGHSSMQISTSSNFQISLLVS